MFQTWWCEQVWSRSRWEWFNPPWPWLFEGDDVSVFDLSADSASNNETNRLKADHRCRFNSSHSHEQWGQRSPVRCYRRSDGWQQTLQVTAELLSSRWLLALVTAHSGILRDRRVLQSEQTGSRQLYSQLTALQLLCYVSEHTASELLLHQLSDSNMSWSYAPLIQDVRHKHKVH